MASVLYRTATPHRTDARDRRLIHGVVSRFISSFLGASSPHIVALETCCRTFTVRRGDVIARRGARLPGVFALAYGFVKLVLRGAREEGRVLRVVAAGQTFSEATALLGRPAPYDVVAIVDCRLVVIPSAAIFSLMDCEPRVARGMVRLLAERSLMYVGEVESATMRRGTQRLASYLRSLAQPDEAKVCVVHLPVSKSVVAARLGLHRETLSRLLRQFADDGLIAVSRRDIAILDPERLTEVAS